MRQPTIALALTVVLTAVLTGCAVTNHLERDGSVSSQARVLVFTDVEISQMTASGLLEPRAEWTQAAEGFVRTSVAASLARDGHAEVVYEEPVDADTAYEETQTFKLHDKVSESILVHRMGGGGGRLLLPTVQKSFDWSVGTQAQSLKRRLGADYALFVYLRDGYQSAGRVATSLIFAALFGAALPAPQQTGYASLVDLETGDVIWFNHLVTGANSDDVRTSAGGARAAQNLLDGLPL